MSPEQWRGFILGALFAGAVVLGLSDFKGAAHAADIAHWKDELRKATAERRTDSVEVVKHDTRTQTQRQTINIHDTTEVIEYLYRTDTLRMRCMACIASASRVAVAADTVILKVGANARRWYDRVGVTAGYGITLNPSGEVHHGLIVGATVRVWP